MQNLQLLLLLMLKERNQLKLSRNILNLTIVPIESNVVKFF